MKIEYRIRGEAVYAGIKRGDGAAAVKKGDGAVALSAVARRCSLGPVTGDFQQQNL